MNPDSITNLWQFRRFLAITDGRSRRSPDSLILTSIRPQIPQLGFQRTYRPYPRTSHPPSPSRVTRILKGLKVIIPLPSQPGSRPSPAQKQRTLFKLGRRNPKIDLCYFTFYLLSRAILRYPYLGVQKFMAFSERPACDETMPIPREVGTLRKAWSKMQIRTEKG